MSTNSAGFSSFKPQEVSRNIKDYADIIKLGRPITTTTPMSISDRAAQFAPFAALTGHQELITAAENSPTIDSMLVLDDSQTT